MICVDFFLISGLIYEHINKNIWNSIKTYSSLPRYKHVLFSKHIIQKWNHRQGSEMPKAYPCHDVIFKDPRWCPLYMYISWSINFVMVIMFIRYLFSVKSWRLSCWIGKLNIYWKYMLFKQNYFECIYCSLMPHAMPVNCYIPPCSIRLIILLD